MAVGTVKWFSEEKGYGIISPDEGGEEVLIHHTGKLGIGFRRSLDEGPRVRYESTHGKWGTRARNVRKV